MDRLHFLDLSPHADRFAETPDYDIFPPSDVEREPLARRIRDEVEAVRPSRVLIDGMTQLRQLSPNSFQFRKEALAFLRFVVQPGCTAAFTSESNEGPDEDLQFIADGVITLESAAGPRRLSVTKFRGSDFRPGCHTLRLSRRGMEVFPRLLPEDFSFPFEPDCIPFSVPKLDRMLSGGLERGTPSRFSPGQAALGRPRLECSLPWPPRLAASVRRFMSSRRRAHHCCGAAKRSAFRHRLSVRDEDLVAHLHALAKYLQNMGVAVLLINEVEAITGDFRVTDVGVSYMADNILFLRYLELRGEMAKALGVLKKRLSDFEKTLREIRITAHGIEIGEPLRGLRGILRGEPEWTETQALRIGAGESEKRG